jgi:hypothetical protein
MSQKKLIKPLIDAMRPKRRRGAIPTVTPCPYCGLNMKQTDHAAHRPGCREAFKNAPPQSADFMHDAGGGYNEDLSFPQT